MEDISEVRTSTRLSPPRGIRPDTAYTVEEAEEDEEARARVTKKMKPYLNGRGGERKPPHNDVVVEEIKDVEMSYANERPAAKMVPPSIGVTNTASPKTVFGHKPTSAPKEPSKLRYSYQPEVATSSPSTTPLATPSAGIEEELSNKQANNAVTRDPKTTVLALPTTALPTFTFTIAATFTLTPAEKLARERAASKAEASLPTFTLNQKPEANPSSSVVSAPAVGFDWSAAGIKPPGGISGNWTCSTCMLSNPASATEKCTICDTPRSPKSAPIQKPETNASVGIVAATSTNAFDWSAAGIKPPAASSGSWSCSVCMLSNPASATEKCTVCDAPR